LELVLKLMTQLLERSICIPSICIGTGVETDETIAVEISIHLELLHGNWC